VKIVVDTNVLVSALIQPRGVPAQIMSYATDFCLVTTEEILAELRRVLNYPRIRRKYALTDHSIEKYVLSLRQDSIVIDISQLVIGASEDPDDDKLLVCADECSANCIVSGDPHLLTLETYKEIPILTPRQFLDSLTYATRYR
jgi:putative PIN family toxin of toxin-antitoxin system